MRSFRMHAQDVVVRVAPQDTISMGEVWRGEVPDSILEVAGGFLKVVFLLVFYNVFCIGAVTEQLRFKMAPEASECCQNGGQDGPCWRQDAPKMLQDGAKMAHVGAKLLQDGVKMAHVGAKMLQNGAKMLQDGPCWRQDASTILRDGFNMPQGRRLAPKMGQDDTTGTPNVA